MSYQSWPGEPGSSDSQEKLKAIRLDKSLRGLSLLDLGCNEGFFCIEAHERGAKRVVGLDRGKERIERARERSQGLKNVEFLNQGWDRLPEEKFDRILLLSALHYERRPLSLLNRIGKLLTPGGKLILETGVVMEPGRTVVRTQRGPGPVYYPTYDMLLYDYLAPFSTRLVGPSVNQKGDPVQRYVFHCSLRRPNVVLTVGRGNVGKTTLSRQLSGGGGQLVSTDAILSHLRRTAKKRKSALPDNGLFSFLKEVLESERSLAKIIEGIEANGLGEDFAELIFDHISKEKDLVVVEGFGLRGETLKHLSSMLEEHANVWVVTNSSDRSNPVLSTGSGKEAGKSNEGSLEEVGEVDIEAGHRLDEGAGKEEELRRVRKRWRRDRAELERARRENASLRSRRSVRLALGVADRFGWLFRLVRWGRGFVRGGH